MALAQNYVSNERVVKSITGEIVLDIRPNKIERIFHLSILDDYYGVLNDIFDRCYIEHREETNDII